MKETKYSPDPNHPIVINDEHLVMLDFQDKLITVNDIIFILSVCKLNKGKNIVLAGAHQVPISSLSIDDIQE